MANLDPNRLRDMNRYWQAANYLTIGQIYLQENPLLREPLRPEHISIHSACRTCIATGRRPIT